MARPARQGEQGDAIMIPNGMEGPARVLFVGLDGVEPTLVRAWAKDGTLPVLSRLLDRSAAIEIEALAGFGSGANWPAFYTGMSPAEHGRVFHRQIEPGEYQAKISTSATLQYDMFWDILSRGGRRVAVLDAPKSRLSDSLNGVQIADWMTHGVHYPATCSTPAEVAHDTLSRYGPDPAPTLTMIGRDAEAFAAYRDIEVDKVRRRTRLSREYLEQGDWDFFMTVYGEPHCIGHECWHFHDAEHPRHDPAAAAVVGDPVRDIYRAVDEAVGELIAAAGPDCLTLVYCAHGMGPNYTGQPVFDEVLRRLDGRAASPTLQGTDAVRRVWRLLPLSFRRRFSPLAERVYERSLQTDRRSRRFFALPMNDSHGAIRINLAGREPAGLVSPGPEFDALCAEVIRDLSAVVNCDSGEPLIASATRTRDIYSGTHLDRLPDIIVEWNRSSPIRRVASPRIGEVDATREPDRSGDHTMAGLLLAQGLADGRRAAGRAKVTAIAPTIAALFGLPFPQGSGSPISEIAGGRPLPLETA
jgi:predicted AlkP superfamily phosphohydrolase/phosphomutase